MKKVFVIALFLILVLSLTGCATIRYSVTISTGGERVIDYSVIFDADEVNQDDYQMVEMYFTYLTTINENSEYVVGGDDNNELTFRIHYDSQTDYYIAMGITGYEVDDPLEPVEEGILLRYESTLLDVDKADFASYALSYLSYCDPEIGEFAVKYLGNHGQSAGICLDCIYSITTVENSTREYVNTLKSSVSCRDALADVAYESMKLMGYDLAILDIYFDYSHVYDSVEGINADSVDEKTMDLGTQKVYTWKLDPMSRNEIRVSQTTPNVWLWELVAIFAGVIVIAVGFTIVFVKSKSGNKKKKNNDAEHNEPFIDSFTEDKEIDDSSETDLSDDE